MSLQRNAFIPAGLTTIYTSPSGMSDLRTGKAFNFGGLYVGLTLDLTEAEAQAYSTSLHEGRYRFVQLSTAATAANVVQGSVGLLKTVVLGVNVVTSFEDGLIAGVRPVVFLAAVTAAQVTAGAYVFIQESGIASCKVKGSQTGSKGDLVVAATGDAGLITAPTQSGNPTYALAKTIIGQALADFTDAALASVQLSLPPVQG